MDFMLVKFATALEKRILRRPDFSLLERYRGRYFITMSATFSLMSLVSFLLWLLSGGVFTTASFSLWLVLLLVLIAPVVIFYFSQSIHLAYQSLLIAHFILYLLVISVSGYYHSPMMINLFYIPLIALLSGRAVTVVRWSTLSVVAVIVFFLCEQFQAPPLFSYRYTVSSELWYQWNLITCVLISGILALAYERTVQVITDILVNERQYYERDALTDSLTGLVNGHQLERVTQSILQQMHTLQFIAVDIVDFTNINTTYGHHTGDQVLEAVAKRLLKSVSQHDVVSRLEKDHFIILFPKIKDKEDIKIIKDSLDKQLQLPVLTKKHEIDIECTVLMDNISNVEKNSLKFYKEFFVEQYASTVIEARNA